MIKIVGDINFSDGFFDTGIGIGTLIKNGMDPFKHLPRENGDVWIGNCECVLSKKSDKAGIYQNQFRMNPEDLTHINHLDIYGVANNHVMQHGPEAYEDTLQSISRDLRKKYIGSKDKKFITIQHQNRDISIISFSQREEKYSEPASYWHLPEYSEITNIVNQLPSTHFKIAYVHWGIEFIDKPYRDQKQFARFLIDQGFDLIIGMHPHVLQGFEIYNGKYIFYSLGNFLFNMPLESTCYAAIVNVDFEHQEPLITIDYVKKQKDFSPKIIDKRDVPSPYTFDYLNKRLKIQEENELYFLSAKKFERKYRKSNYKYILNSAYNYNVKDIISIFNDFKKRKLTIKR